MATATRKRTKIVMDREELKESLAALATVVPSRAAKPVIQNVLLFNGGITRTDMDLTLNMQSTYTADPLLLPFHRFKLIVDSCRNGEITLEPDGTQCRISSEHGAQWTLPTEDAAEFPKTEIDSQSLKPGALKIPSDQFASAITKTQYAVDTESSRYALGAIRIEYLRETGVAAFVATDGRRISVVTVHVGGDLDDFAVMLPQRAALLMAAQAKSLGGLGEVALEHNGAVVVGTVQQNVITARQIEGRFPRWQDAVPKRDGNRACVVRDELKSATTAAAIVTSEQSNGVTYDFGDGVVTLTAQSSEAGKSVVECPLTQSGNHVRVKLNPRFVRDFLTPCDDGSPVYIDAVDAGSAVVFGTDLDDEAGTFGYTCVIMPLAEDAT
jgi:DNA polymerase-3 subunit beta